MSFEYEIGAIAGAVVAAAAALVGLREYSLAQKWKRAEFAVAQVRLLSEDPTLAFCCKAIDWGVGPLVVPPKYRAIVSTPTVVHDWALMGEALKPRLSPLWRDAARGAQFLLYRYAFDDFCGYLDALALYRRLGLVGAIDLEGVEDYLWLMAEPPYARDAAGKPDQQFFQPFVKAFYGRRVWPWLKAVAASRLKGASGGKA